MSVLTTASTDSPARNTIQAGGIDWLASWREMYDTEHAQTEAFMHATVIQSDDHWAGQGTRFARATGHAPQPDSFMRFVLPHLQPEDTVLDVGAGSGRHTAFLAERGARVIAVEPSATMRHHLTQRLGSKLAERVTVVLGRWPNVDVPPCDIMICSHVIYGVREIGPFLTHMHARARRACFIVAGVRQPSYMLAPFWERYYGTPRAALPGALECVNALYQLGMAPQVTRIPTRPYTFADETEAVEDIRWRLRCDTSPATDARLRALIGELLERTPDHHLCPRAPTSETLIIWWRRNNEEEHG